MKISELPKITSVRRDIELPLAVQDENYSITLGQILDAAGDGKGGGIVRFGMVRSSSTNVQYAGEAPPMTLGGITVFDTLTDTFYRAFKSDSLLPQMPASWVYYETWEWRGDYYDDNGIRKDTLFLSEADGRLYFYDGTTLRSAGITEAQVKQIQLNTPIEVESEEMMEQMIAAGEVEDGQLYFVAE